MRISIKILINLLLILVITSASAQKDSTDIKRLSNRRLTKKIVNQYSKYDNLSFKIDAEIETASKKYKLNITYRNVRDSLIWINVNHNTGVPVARLLLSPDSTKMLNRLDNEYLIISNEKIVERFNYEIDFDMLQSIFVAELINLELEKNIIQSYKHYKVYFDSCSYSMQNIKKKRVNRLVKKDKIDEYYFHRVDISHLFKILSMSLENNLKKQKINIEYSDYNNENQIPGKINILLGNKDGETKVKLKIKKVKFDKDKLSTSFKIPKKYTKAEIKSPEKE